MANSIIGAAVQGAVKGASRSGGMVGAPFRAARTGVSAIKSVNSGMKSFKKKQVATTKPKNTNFRKK